MKKNRYALISVMILMAISLAACRDSKASGGDELVMVDPILVELTLNAETVAAGENVLIQAKVTQAGMPVEDADKVEFEIVREGGGSPEKVPIQHLGDGSYELNKVFNEPGNYRIISHVTARGQHSMPLKELKVAG
ncbi:FixH family protein [Paenibacillus dakarensis]|uniref:FixH family protein n=1 Tax=Paenibacillus dakarensis TaxID=1527293 RepID=UPI0006D5B315|nr:FixH family protein [Paenibacillus dakarensis]